jgi:hypothetical protein
MASEGMVHALEIIHSLLALDGILIDIHPSQQPARLFVEQAGQHIPAGTVQEVEDYIEYVQASQALQKAVEQGWYVEEQNGIFDYRIVANSLAEFQHHLAENWKDAILSPETIQNIAALLAQTPDSRLNMIEQIRIARYRSV